MFNFFDEIKKSVGSVEQNLQSYNLVMLSGRALYVEGHLGLSLLSKELIGFKVKRGRVTVEGENLVLHELTENTLTITGQIKKVEVV